MPHTTTKSRRTKRFDTRPNAKLRAKANKQTNDKLKIQDIRVTRKLKGERKDRVTEQEQQAFAKYSKDEKLLRALKKKLRSINDLLEKKKRGEALNAEQKDKVNQLDQVLEDMEGLIKKTSKTSRREEEEVDEEQSEDGDEDEEDEEMGELVELDDEEGDDK